MADRNEVVVIITKEGKVAVDVEHQNPAVCDKLSAKARAAYAFMGVRMRHEHDDPARPIPIPEAERVKGGG